MDIVVYSHTGYDVISYFRSAFTEVQKTAENADSDGFGSNFSGAALCLPHRLVGILFVNIIYRDGICRNGVFTKLYFL